MSDAIAHGDASPATALAARLGAALAISVATLLWVGPALFRVDLFDGDAGQHIWWLYRYADPALFPADLMVDYFRTMAPLGYRSLYAVIAPYIDVLWAAEALSAVLLLLSGWLAWKIGASIEAPDPAMRGLLAVAVLIALVALTRSNLLPPLAFQRTFALPIVLFCIWALIAKRYAWVGVSWLGAALFYPVLLPVLGLTACCVFLRDLVVEKRMPRWWMLNVVLGIAALALAILGVPSADQFGPAFTYEEATAMPEFGPAGRLQLYVAGLSGDFRFHMTGLGWSPYVILALAAATTLLCLSGRRRLIPFPAWAMAGTGVGLWALMRLFPEVLMFGLYLPNRHSRYAIAVFAIVVLAGAAYLLADKAAEWVANRLPSLSRGFLLGLLALAVPIGTACVLWPQAYSRWNRPVDHDLENAYAYIASLPKDTLVAAHPTLADFVPLRALRSVLTSTETSQPWRKGYYDLVKPRVEASLRAAYAADISELDAQMSPYGVKVFVTGPSVWWEDSYHEPFQSEFLQGLIKRGREHGFALQAPPSDRVLFRSGDYYVVRVGSSRP